MIGNSVGLLVGTSETTSTGAPPSGTAHPAKIRANSNARIRIFFYLTSLPSVHVWRHLLDFVNVESLLTFALVNVNDRWFVVPNLLPYEVKTIDIGAALVSGDGNTVAVWGGGQGSSVMISDVMPTLTNTFVYPDAPLY